MLRLWKVGLPADDVLEHTLGSLELNEMELLSPVDEMQKVFINPPRCRQLHIAIVQRLPEAVCCLLTLLLSLHTSSGPNNVFWTAPLQAHTTPWCGCALCLLTSRHKLCNNPL
jgi:hypothetical protein